MTEEKTKIMEGETMRGEVPMLFGSYQDRVGRDGGLGEVGDADMPSLGAALVEACRCTNEELAMEREMDTQEQMKRAERIAELMEGAILRRRKRLELERM